MLILLKLHRSIGHGLKTCMWFGYNPQIRLCYVFCNLNLVFFSGINTINVCRQYVPCMENSLLLFQMSPYFLKKSMRGHKFSEFACYNYSKTGV